MVRIPLLPPPPTTGGKQFGSSPGKPSEVGRVAAGHLARVAGEQERGKLTALLARRAAQGRALPGAATVLLLLFFRTGSGRLATDAPGSAAGE